MRITAPARTACVALGLTLAATLTACTSVDRTTPVTVSGVHLVAFDSCTAALRQLRAAAKPYVGPYGFQFGSPVASDAGAGAVEDRAAAAAEGAPSEAKAAPEHSTTNVHERGVDEPDVVKTDGRRVVSVVDGALRVVDAASRREIGTLRVAKDPQQTEAGGLKLLMSGERVLVMRPKAALPGDVPPADETLVGELELLLVDLSGEPEVVSRMTFDGQYVDARMVDGTVHLVTRSVPRVPFQHPEDPQSTGKAQRENYRILAGTTIDDWLPRYEIDNGRSVVTGRIGCDQVSYPVGEADGGEKRIAASGTSMLTVMSLPLEAAALSAQDAVTVVADGTTVYGSGERLYVANDQRMVIPFDARRQAPVEPRTDIFVFEVSASGAPRHVAAGAVPGWLLNQYAMSEYDGYLRVATTSADEQPGDPARPVTESAVYVLAREGRHLTKVGSVGGLGKDEQIYAVRFLGPMGYVVTFRQVDPLYVIDLRDPKRPKVTGELKITGYSAYLHPVADDRLLGVGQEATTEGRRLGLQVSLFDVSDPTAPSRLAQYHLEGAGSTAEFDPHAFLYWPKTGLLVLPVIAQERSIDPYGTALVLTVSDHGIAELGEVVHPGEDYRSMIQRSLVIGDSLWTVSAAGMRVNDAETLETQAWLAFQ